MIKKKGRKRVIIKIDKRYLTGIFTFSIIRRHK